jgi:tRNA pseudouridine38-40 synthase
MARYQLKLAYDGTEFFGFQRQGSTRTVQQVLEEALAQVGWQESTLLFAGRTDTGVHASGQVAVADLEWKHSTEKLKTALNAKLPQDVAVSEVALADVDFHPRYDALSRTYIYSIVHTPERDPLKDRFAWRLWPRLDEEKLFQAASLLPGTHDFSAFGRAMKPGSSTVRTVLKSEWRPIENGWEYCVEANAFLYHMVRRIVFIQVQVARGKMDLSAMRLGIDEQAAMKPGLAPARGLNLWQVTYPRSKQANWLRETVNDDVA